MAGIFLIILDSVRDIPSCPVSTVRPSAPQDKQSGSSGKRIQSWPDSSCTLSKCVPAPGEGPVINPFYR